MIDKALAKVDELLASTRELNENVEKYKRGTVSRDEVEKMLRDLEHRFGDDGRPAIFPTGEKQKDTGLSYQKLFCKGGEALSRDGWESPAEFFGALLAGTGDGRLAKGWTESGPPSEGAATVPTEYAARIFDYALENEVVLPRATVYPMRSDTLKIPGVVTGDHSASIYGGCVAGFTGEGTDFSENIPRYRTIELRASKLYCYGEASSEWFDDSVESMAHIERSFVNTAGWKLDWSFLRGSGAGEPLGILNSPCLVEVAIEQAQGLDVRYANICNMLAALHPASWKRACWVMHPDVLGMLLKMLGGNDAPIAGSAREQVFQVSGDGQFRMMTLPAYVSEKMPALGTPGDILLADFSQYGVGLRQGMKVEISRDYKFKSDEIASRLIMRVDGQPLWERAVTCADGSKQQSPFVVLAERSE